jgi:hypothetical protein
MAIVINVLIALAIVMMIFYFCGVAVIIKEKLDERHINRLYKKMYPQYNNK